VAWSPEGRALAWCGQTPPAVVLLSGLPTQAAEAWQRADQLRQEVRLPGLPLKCLAFLSERALVGAGFDGAPLLLEPDDGGGWEVRPLQQGEAQGGRCGDCVRVVERPPRECAPPLRACRDERLAGAGGAGLAGGADPQV
jgi:hypothetical protein